MSNICIEKADPEEKIKVADHFTNQLKNSGYGRKMSRDIVVAGLLGWMRKIRRIKERENKDIANFLLSRVFIEGKEWYLFRQTVSVRRSSKVPSMQRIFSA